MAGGPGWDRGGRLLVQGLTDSEKAPSGRGLSHGRLGAASPRAGGPALAPAAADGGIGGQCARISLRRSADGDEAGRRGSGGAELKNTLDCGVE